MFINYDISVRNDSGETAPGFAMLRVTGAVFLNGKLVVTVGKPTTTWSWEWLINGPAEIPNGKYGDATAGPWAMVQYDTGTPAYGEGWGARPSQWTASKGYYGLRIIGAETTGTNKRVLVKMKPIDHIFVKLSGGTLAQGSTQTAKIWAGTGGSEAETTFDTITVRDWFMKSGATAIANGKKLRVENNLNANYAVLAECA